MKIKIEFGKNIQGIYHREGIHGFIEISQKNKDEPTQYLVAVGGLNPNKLHGFHIHEKPVTNSSDLDKTCATCGGHFNPTGKDHGSFLNSDKGENSHVGDLINNLKADEKGNVIVQFFDDRACLLKSNKNKWSIIGKSIVIHNDPDDLGREGISKDIPYLITEEYCEETRSKNSNKILGKIRKLKDSEKYSSDKKRVTSTTNGNAGKRIACANIAR